MVPDPRISLDFGRGEARLGPAVVPIAGAGSRGEVRVGGPDGPILRPLTFEERARIVGRAAGSVDPAACLAADALRAATVRPGVADHEVLELMALVLAGAGYALPPFPQTAQVVVARAAGWDYERLAATEAIKVDAVAAELVAGEPREQTRWSRLVMCDARPDELDVLRADLAESLLRRAASQPTPASPLWPEELPPAAPHTRAPHAQTEGPRHADDQPAPRLRLKRISSGELAADTFGRSPQTQSAAGRESRSQLPAADASPPANVSRDGRALRSPGSVDAANAPAPAHVEAAGDGRQALPHEDESRRASACVGGLLQTDRHGGRIQFSVPSDGEAPPDGRERAGSFPHGDGAMLAPLRLPEAERLSPEAQSSPAASSSDARTLLGEPSTFAARPPLEARPQSGTQLAPRRNDPPARPAVPAAEDSQTRYESTSARPRHDARPAVSASAPAGALFHAQDLPRRHTHVSADLPDLYAVHAGTLTSQHAADARATASASADRLGAREAGGGGDGRTLTRGASTRFILRGGTAARAGGAAGAGLGRPSSADESAGPRAPAVGDESVFDLAAMFDGAGPSGLAARAQGDAFFADDAGREGVAAFAPDELADRLALLLQTEADLRGIEP